MISLATSCTSNRISLDGGDTLPFAGANGAFSLLLAQLGLGTAEEAGESALEDASDTAEEATPLTVAISGIALPVAAEGGKELPVELPEAGEDTQSDGAIDPVEAEAAAAVEASLAAVIGGPELAVPATAPNAETAEPAQTADAAPAMSARPQPAPPVSPVPPRQAGEAQTLAGERTAAAPREAAVAVHVAPPAGGAAPQSQTGYATSGGDSRRDATTTTTRAEPVAERAATALAQSESLRQTDQATVASVTQSPPAGVARPNEAASQAPRVDTLQELTRIVDRLAAARELFAPAAESLAIEHAEFGELSLRFDQRRDGGLSVQLSASNPEAHRAVAQAVGAQSFQMAADDRTGAGQSQAQPQSSTSRGTAEREASGNGGAPRHEQQAAQQQHRRAPRQDPGAGTRRTGIFA